jgi:hypothetical protein
VRPVGKWASVDSVVNGDRKIKDRNNTKLEKYNIAMSESCSSTFSFCLIYAHFTRIYLVRENEEREREKKQYKSI